MLGRWLGSYSSTLAAAGLLGLLAVGCANEGERTAEPVEACERAGDPCRLDNDEIGVCVHACQRGEEGDCGGCMTCTEQNEAAAAD